MAAESKDSNVSSDQEETNDEVEQVSDCETEFDVVLDSDIEESSNCEGIINYSKLKQEAISVMTGRMMFQGLKALTDSSSFENPEESNLKSLTTQVDCQGGEPVLPATPTDTDEAESLHQASEDKCQAGVGSSGTVEGHLNGSMEKKELKTEKQKMTSGRREYSRRDGQLLLDAVCDFGAFRSIKGNKFWKEMEEILVLGHHRTFHSIRNHFLKTVLPSVLKKKKVYAITSDNLKNLKDGLIEISKSSRFPAPTYLDKLNANTQLKKYDNRI